jgi:hypothetical protein
MAARVGIPRFARELDPTLEADGLDVDRRGDAEPAIVLTTTLGDAT